MTNEQVIKAFCKKEKAPNSTGTLSSTGTKLFSYHTCIAQWWQGRFLILNLTRYSVTSSKHLSYLKYHYKWSYAVENVPIEETDLVKYLKRNFKLNYGNYNNK